MIGQYYEDLYMGEDEGIRPIGTKGFEPYPAPDHTKDIIQQVTEQPDENIINDDVSTPNLMWLGFKQTMATVIILSKASQVMPDTTVVTPATSTTPAVVAVATKPWYASKTLWLNGLTFAWYFIGPMVGIPILTPEVTGIALTVANVLLRVITKQPLTLS
jgi:hypothetical protein